MPLMDKKRAEEIAILIERLGCDDVDRERLRLIGAEIVQLQHWTDNEEKCHMVAALRVAALSEELAVLERVREERDDAIRQRDALAWRLVEKEKL